MPDIRDLITDHIGKLSLVNLELQVQCEIQKERIDALEKIVAHLQEQAKADAIEVPADLDLS